MEHTRWLMAGLTVTVLVYSGLHDKIVINYYLIGILMDHCSKNLQAGECRTVITGSGREFAGERSQGRQHRGRNPVIQLFQRGAYP